MARDTCVPCPYNGPAEFTGNAHRAETVNEVLKLQFNIIITVVICAAN